MKQKVLSCYGSSSCQHDIETAITMGWNVQSVTVNSETNYWIVILYKNQ